MAKKEDEIKKLIEEINRLEEEISILDGKKLELMWKVGEIADQLHELGIDVV